jgi:hypothetical protein
MLSRPPAGKLEAEPLGEHAADGRGATVQSDGAADGAEITAKLPLEQLPGQHQGTGLIGGEQATQWGVRFPACNRSFTVAAPTPPYGAWSRE